MSTVYRFPDQLGGGEYEEHRRLDGSTEGPVGTKAFLINECLVCVAKNLLTEVPPPLPPEPGNRTVVRITSPATHISVIAERDDRAGTAEGALRWYTTAEGPCQWGDLVHPASIVTRLVPDPFAEPVELPWASQPYAPGIMRTSVHVTSDGVEDENSNGGHIGVAVAMPAEQARAKARALWAAADAAEAES